MLVARAWQYGHVAMATFVGLDLAWKATNESGICWLEADTRTSPTCRSLEAAARDGEELADEIASVEGTVVVAIDAPLLYTSKRWAEREIGRRFGRYKVSAHSAHAAVKQGWTAGIDLGKALECRGFRLDPDGLRGAGGERRVVVEVYPHTVYVRLFGLDERIPYKRKKGRNVDFRRSAMRDYQRYLEALVEHEAPGCLDSPDVRDILAPRTAETARGKALKRLEDKLDGLTCAMAAWLAWRDPDGWEPIGDLDGYMLVPLPPH